MERTKSRIPCNSPMRYNTTSSTSATTNQIASCLPTRHSFPMMLTPRSPPHTPSAYRCPRRARRSRAAASTCCACHAQMPCDPDVGTTPCSARHQAHSITSDPIPSSIPPSAGYGVPISSSSPTRTSSGRCRPHHPHIDRPHFLTSSLQRHLSHFMACRRRLCLDPLLRAGRATMPIIAGQVRFLKQRSTLHAPHRPAKVKPRVILRRSHSQTIPTRPSLHLHSSTETNQHPHKDGGSNNAPSVHLMTHD